MSRYRSWLVFAVTVLLSEAAFLFGQVAWVHTLDEALKMAQSGRKFVVIDVSASWCPPCQRMGREVYPSTEFIEFSRNQIYMHLDAENDPEGIRIADKLKVHSYPTILILDSKGEEIHRLAGGRTTRQLIQDLKEIFDHPEPLKTLIERAKKESNDFKLQLQAGDRCLETNLSHAISFLKRARALSSGQDLADRTSVLVSLSVACFKDGKYQDSLQAMEELEKLDPRFAQDTELRMQHARVLILLKKYDEGYKMISDVFRTSRSRGDKNQAKRIIAQLPSKYRKADKEYSQKLSKAKKSFDSGKLEEALDLATQAAESSPLSADVQILLAAIHFRAMQTENDSQKKAQHTSTGLNHLRLGLKLDPEDLNHYQTAKGVLASRYIPTEPSAPEARKSYEKAEVSFAEGRYRDAAQFYIKTIEQEPGFGKAYLHLGDCFFASRNFEDALKLYKQASARSPLDASTYRFTADALMKLGKREEARQAMVSSLLADPEYPPIWKNLESLARAEGKELERHDQIIPIQFLLLSMDIDSYDESLFNDVPSETVPAWQEYIRNKLIWRQQKFKKIFPNEAFYHATFEEERDCLEGLVKKWDSMREQDPALRDVNLDFLHQTLVDGHLQAFIFLELFTEEYRNSYETWKKRNLQVAKDYIERYLLGAPQTNSDERYNSSAIEAYNSGVESQKKGDKVRALEFYRKALAQEPRMVEALHNSSAIYLETGDKENARETLEKWIEIEPASAQPLESLAHLSYQEGDYESAVSLMEKAVALEKDEKTKAGYLETLSRLQSYSQRKSPLPKGSSLNRSPADALLKAASDALWKGKAEEAIEILVKLLPGLDEGPPKDEATLMLGVAYYNAGEMEQAQDYVSQFLAKHPKHPKALEVMEGIKAKRK